MGLLSCKGIGLIDGEKEGHENEVRWGGDAEEYEDELL